MARRTNYSEVAAHDFFLSKRENIFAKQGLENQIAFYDEQ